MNILLVGNGFDLANGLPTRYNDFLDVCDGYFADGTSYDPNNDTYIDFSKSVSDANSRMMNQLVSNNAWVCHFRGKRNKLGDKWGDFESEIESFIKILYQRMKATNNDIVNISDYPPLVFPIRLKIGNLNITYKMLIVFLYEELKELTKALDLYFTCYVEKKVVSTNEMPFPDNINCLLSFNYTSTYINKFYKGKIDEIEWCYIHGKAGFKNNNEDSSLVLGFDDHYLEKGQAVLETVPFEKYYQRLVNRTENNYLYWLEKINNISEINSRCKIDDRHFVNLYIFGHSLAPSDGDILKAFIANPSVKTTIYYYQDEDRAEKVANLAVVLGPDELIKLAGGLDPAIKFVKQ